MRKEDISVRELVKECLAVKGGLAEGNGVAFELDLEDPDALISGDRALLRTAVNNLIDGAVRYNRQGGRVTITHRSELTRESLVVADSGDGIPYEELRSMQELICRGSVPVVDDVEAMDRRLIGLTIVRDVADLHGGRVGVRSVPGEGTAISIHLPRNAA
jgi:signal transduction histidine kinase